MKIGELAKLTDCSIQAIRYYEKEGLIASSARSEGNFRLYNQTAVQRLLFIKLCRKLDLSMFEIRQLLTLKSSPGAQCDQVNHMMDTHIQQVETRIQELVQLREHLKKLRRSCSSERTIEECGILQQLNSDQHQKR